MQSRQGIYSECQKYLRNGENLGWYEFAEAIGSPERGAGPAIAGSEGSGFSSEKPPPEAEYRPGYSENPIFAPAAQRLGLLPSRTLQSAALPALLCIKSP